MKGSHLTLIFIGLLAQAFGWTLAPRRWKAALAGLALLDVVWFLWFLSDNRALSASGFWALSPVATWMCVHLVMVPIIAVEALAKVLSRWRWWIRLAGVAAVLGGYGWGLAEAYGPPVVTELSLAFPDLPPAFDGYRMVLVSDFHAGAYAGTRTLGRWARKVDSLKGDLLIADGDFIAILPEEAERPGVAFDNVNPPDGRIAILGNHDQVPSDNNVARRMERHGWKVLVNDVHAIRRGGQQLLFLGALHPMDRPVELDWKGRPWPDGFRIGLCHSPPQWPQMRQAGARLTLSAHTHGGQVNLDPLYNAADEITPYVSGLFREGADELYVTRGLGLTSIPLRFRCRPEIVVITLHRS